MDQETARVRFTYPQDWLNSIGGNIGEEFKRAIDDQKLLAEFINNHYLEAIQIDDSYFSNFQKPIPQFLPFITQSAAKLKAGLDPATQASSFGKERGSPNTLHLTISGEWLLWLPLIALFLFLLFR